MTDVHDMPAAERLQIVAACERLSLDYAHFADHRRHADLAQLFAPDGEMHLFGQVHVGPEAILRAVGGGGPERTTVHVTSNIRVDALTSDSAVGTAYVVAYVGERGKAAGVLAPVIVGIYRDAYVRADAGWRFARRAFEPLVTAG